MCGGSGTDHDQIAQAELLKLKKNGQFPDETVRIKVAPVQYVNTDDYYSRCDTVEFCQEQSLLVTHLSHSGNVSDR